MNVIRPIQALAGRFRGNVFHRRIIYCGVDYLDHQRADFSQQAAFQNSAG